MNHRLGKLRATSTRLDLGSGADAHVFLALGRDENVARGKGPPSTVVLEGPASPINSTGMEDPLLLGDPSSLGLPLLLEGSLPLGGAAEFYSDGTIRDVAMIPGGDIYIKSALRI